MEEKPKVKLFREKSLEAIESPESLNDYLRVTSPGVWLALAAVIALLVGGILWGIFGRIETRLPVAVVSDGARSVCLTPYSQLEKVMATGEVTVEGQTLSFDRAADCETVIISETTSPYVRLAGRLDIGDVAVEIPLTASLDTGVYSGSVTTESLKPMSLLLQ